jgi:hypothetical protein
MTGTRPQPTPPPAPDPPPKGGAGAPVAETAMKKRACARPLRTQQRARHRPPPHRPTVHDPLIRRQGGQYW